VETREEQEVDFNDISAEKSPDFDYLQSIDKLLEETQEIDSDKKIFGL